MYYGGIFMNVTAALAARGEQHGGLRFGGNWNEKKWLNTSGPVYGAMTDNCGTGPPAAPNNVHVDRDGYEVVFRQPVNDYELDQVLDAAYLDPWKRLRG